MNKKTTKRSLLASVMALMLCVAMLVGTTFAWFTDTASTSVNKIQSGSLKMKVTYKNTETENVFRDLTKESNVFLSDALWEPGHVEYAVLNVKNVGTLALKYKLGINIANETGSTNVYNNEFKLSEFIKYAVVDGDLTANAATATRAAMMTAAGAGTSLTTPYTKDDGVLNEKNAADTVTLVVWMPEDVGNDANHAPDKAAPVINLGINVLATQNMHENDSFDNTYDQDAPLNFIPVSSTKELKDAFKNAKAGETVNVSLNSDVTITNNELSVVNETQSGIGVGVGDININANGHTIKTTNSGTRCVKIECSDTARNITISGAKIVSESTVGNASENRGVQIFSVNNATINLVNCDIEMKSNDYSYPVKIGGTSENLTVNITGCTLTGANCISSFGKNCTVNITDCVLNSNYAPHATYCGNGIQDKNGTNNTYNIKNTTFNGTNAQPWQSSENSITTINDLGGNVFNTTRTVS